MFQVKGGGGAHPESAVHLLPRTVPWGARRHRHLRRRLEPRSRRGSLRRPSLHHAAGGERLGSGFLGEPFAYPNPFKVLTLTRKGVAEARKLAAERGIDPGQEIGFARTRPADGERRRSGNRGEAATRSATRPIQEGEPDRSGCEHGDVGLRPAA